jgi:hypothetical protein
VSALQADAATLGLVSAADVNGAAVAEGPPEPGMVQCKAPGCGQWFRKQSGRHIYCKQEGCTYRRGNVEQELVEPEGAAAEVLRRLQDPEGGGEVSQELIGSRIRSVGEAQRAGDRAATYGALIDAAVVFVRWADRVQDESVPVKMAPQPGASPTRARERQGQPVGLVHAALASHNRTVKLAQRRVDSLWAMLAARERYEQALRGVEQTAGSADSVGAEELCQAARAAYTRTEAALQAVEAAWAERLEVLRELESAGASVGAPVGGAHERGRRAG